MEELYTPCFLCHAVVREGSLRFDALEPPRTHVQAPCTPCFPCKDVVREGSVQSNHPELLWERDLQGKQAGCFYTSSGWFKYIEPPRTFSNHSIAARPLYIFTEETRWAGFLYTRSGWFKRREPPRTVFNHILTEIAGRVEVFPGCFACTEPTALQGKQSLQGASALVRSCSRTSNLLKPSRTTASQLYQGV